MLRRSRFSIKSPVPLPLGVWLRCSKFICFFLKGESHLSWWRMTFLPTSVSVFIIPVAKSLLAGDPQFHEWALFFNQRTCDPWQVDSSGLVFDAQTWTKEAWILPTKRQEILLSGSHRGLLFRKLLWCGTVTHLWFCMGEGGCIECELKSWEGRKYRNLSSTQFCKYPVKICFNWFRCTATLLEIWFKDSHCILNFIFFKERAMDKIAKLLQQTNPSSGLRSLLCAEGG